MGAAETLAADPDFAKLHTADPKGAEGLMVEALQRDSEGPYARYAGKPDLPLEETATAPRNIIMTAGSLALPGAWMGQAAKAGYGTLGQLGAAAGANEALNLADKATQPGATLKSTLTPGMSDVAAVATPFVAQAVTHPLSTAKSIVAPFARSSQMGQEAANSAVQLQQAKLGADFDYSVASQAKAKAQLQLDYDQQLSSWNTLKAAQVTAKRQAAEDLRQLTSTLKSRNVTDAADWAATRPGVPTVGEVQNAYAAADAIASAHATPLVLPELAAAKKAILTEAAVAAKTPGIGNELSKVLTRVAQQVETRTIPAAQPGVYNPARVGATTGTAHDVGALTLTEMQNGVKYLNDRIAQLRTSPDKYSVARRDALGKVVTAIETGMERLETDPANPLAFRSTLKAANTLYLKQRTDQELTQFMTHDMVSPGPSGQPQLDPRAALKALDTKANERMVGYMRKVIPPDGDGKNLYEMTKDTLTQMASKGQAEWEAQRLLTKTGGMALPPKPVNPLPPQHALPYPAPQGGLTASLGTLGLRAAGAAGGFALGGGAANPYVGVGGAAVGLGAPEVFAKLMQTGWGQRTLLALVHHQGTTISPALVGLATAAVRAGQSGEIAVPPTPVPAQ